MSECTTTAPEGSSVSLCDSFFILAPGDTLTVTQATAPAGLVVDPTTATVPPCVNSDQGLGLPLCDGLVTLFFNDPGLPPIADPDTAKVKAPGQVTVSVLGNDDTQGAPLTSLTIAGQPSHGSVVVLDESGHIRYTPATGFSGEDTFEYTIETANGSATATVTITVTGPTPTPTPSSAPSDPSDSGTSNDTLAATGPGAATGSGLLFGTLLTAAGAAVVLRRWRPWRDHGDG